MKYYKASEEYVKFLGRAVYEDDVLRCAHSGTGAEFIFTGTKAEVTILGDSACTEENAMFAARIAILVNDVRVIDTMQKEAETTYTVWESDTVQDIKITILKLSESRMSTMAIKQIGVEAEGDIYPTKNKDFFIEFVGDSITCAYGVDDECIEHIFSTASEDVTKAFSYRTGSPWMMRSWISETAGSEVPRSSCKIIGTRKIKKCKNRRYTYVGVPPV